MDLGMNARALDTARAVAIVLDMSDDNITEADMLCSTCSDDPCGCQDCAKCNVTGHRDDMSRIGDDLYCENCYDQLTFESMRFAGVR